MLSAAAPRPSPGMDAALAEIGAKFGVAAEIDRFKRRCRGIIRRYEQNPFDEGLFKRYGARAQLLRRSTTADAAAWVACRYATEQRRWRSNDARLSLMVLRELRLLVRLMRAKRLDLQPVIADVLGDYAEAAE